MKKLALFLSIVMVLAMALACSPAASAPAADAPAADAPAADAPAADAPAADAPAAEEGGAYKIGISIPSAEMTFFATMQTEIENAFPTDRIEATVYDAENSQEKQNKDVEDMITMGYDGIVLIPITVEGAAPAIAYANEKGIPVITADRQVTPDLGVEVIGFVGSDHVPMGRGAGELLVEALEAKFPDAEKWNVIEIEGTQGSSAQIDRGKGIHEIIDANDRVNVIASLDGDFLTTNALSIAEDSLIANPDLHGFICHNDNMADGVYQALVNANRVGDVVIIGIDGQAATVQNIVDGGIQGTVIQYPRMVVMATELMADHLDGKTIDEVSFYPTDKCGPADAAAAIAEGKAW